MVHLRLNRRESNPNPQINFISHLPCAEGFVPSAEDAKELLRALAAQIKPVMKEYGFVVNSLEEVGRNIAREAHRIDIITLQYECNRVFLGRNWNNGETIEIVLRGADGTFLGTDMLLDTLCHELAHIKYVHHLQPFQKLWAELRSKVIALQKKGYFGDGFWSSGQRLQDASRAQGDGVGGLAEVLPEYICGGAHSQKRSGYMRSRRARRPRKEVVPSLSTGAQTAKKRKPGSRLTKELPGQGVKLSDDAGSRGKQAQSKRAREERALAVEKRLQVLRGQPGPSTAPELPDGGSEDEEELQPEDDEFRRATMLEVFSAGELEQMRLGPRTTDAARPPDSDELAQVPSQNLGKRPAEETEIDDTPQEIEWPASTSTDSGLAKRRKIGQSILKDEIAYRNKEKLGMTGPGKKLGIGKPRQTKLNAKIELAPPVEITSDWTCATCTLLNHPDYARCAACGEARQFID